MLTSMEIIFFILHVRMTNMNKFVPDIQKYGDNNILLINNNNIYTIFIQVNMVQLCNCVAAINHGPVKPTVG